MVRVAIAVLLFVLLPSVAQAEKRIAFVVGIDKYDNLGPQQQLQRAVNDARSVSAALAPLGFEVVSAENVGRATFNAQWQKFLDQINPGDTAAVYFSGHGVEIEGLNFLLPRDVPNISYGRQEQLKRESLSVSELLLDLRKHKPQVSLLILDACRDHPLVPPEQRALSWGRGLARMDAPSGTFIMYSAGAGETALDRLPTNDPDKVNSVYTRTLLPLMKTPGLPLHDLARQLRREVHDIAGVVPHVQQPAYYDGLIGKFCLAGCGNAPEPKTASSSPVTPPAPSKPIVSPFEEELRRRALLEKGTQPLYLKCTMKEGVMDGHVYSFSIDTVGRKATWVEPGVPLDIIYFDDLRIHTGAIRRISGWPQHDEIGFNFNRLTLAVDAALSRTPSTDEITKCKAELKENLLCQFSIVVASSGGTCNVIARPEDIASAIPQPKPTPKATASPKRCDGVEASVGNERRCLKPKDTFKDCPDCPEMVVVPAGSFTMGSPPDEEGRDSDEGPQRKVTITKPFAVGKFEVTFAEWDACVTAGGCKHAPDDKGWGRGKRPVINVSWDDAKEYVTWLAKNTGRQYRLLSEAEWEYVARAGTTTAFSTGQTITTDQANFDTQTFGGSAKGVHRGKTIEVGSLTKPNAFGLHDMHGNVWEWAEDCFKANYTASPTDNSAWTGGECSHRVSRGGAWFGHPNNIRSANRQETLPSTRSWAIGSRVARTLGR